MTKKFLLHFNVLYLGVFLSLIILPSLAWSQVFDDEAADEGNQEVALVEEDFVEEPQEESPVDENEIVLLVDEPLLEEVLSTSSVDDVLGEEEEAIVEPLADEVEPIVEELVNEIVEEEEEAPIEEVIEEPIVEPIVEEPPFEDTIPTLTVRRFEKPIFLDKEARHSCEADNFRLDVSDKQRISGKILLNKNSDIAYEVEVGSLPDGIDIRFSDNREYLYQPGSSENVLEFDIVRQDGAQKGDFTVPFIYTQKGLGDSSVICQFNIVNL